MQKQKQNIGIKAHDGGCQGLWGGGSGEVLIKRYQLSYQVSKFWDLMHSMATKGRHPVRQT